MQIIKSLSELWSLGKEVVTALTKSSYIHPLGERISMITPKATKMPYEAYHATTTERIGLEQLRSGILAQQNKPIYGLPTRIYGGLLPNKEGLNKITQYTIDGYFGRECKGQPIILKIGSTTPLQTHPIYGPKESQFFPRDATVYILDGHFLSEKFRERVLVKNLPNSTRLEACKRVIKNHLNRRNPKSLHNKQKYFPGR